MIGKIKFDRNCLWHVSIVLIVCIMFQDSPEFIEACEHFFFQFSVHSQWKINPTHKSLFIEQNAGIDCQAYCFTNHTKLWEKSEGTQFIFLYELECCVMINVIFWIQINVFDFFSTLWFIIYCFYITFICVLKIRYKIL